MRRERLAQIHLSIVVTVFSETFSIRETLDILEGNDRAYIKEILLLVSPRASEESFAICRERAARNPRVKILVQKNNPGIGWAYREGMEAAAGNYVALMAADLETEPAAVRVAGAAQPKRFLAGHHEEACIPVSTYQGSARHCGGVLCVPV